MVGGKQTRGMERSIFVAATMVGEYQVDATDRDGYRVIFFLCPAGGNPAGGNPAGGNPAGGNPAGGNEGHEDAPMNGAIARYREDGAVDFIYRIDLPRHGHAGGGTGDGQEEDQLRDMMENLGHLSTHQIKSPDTDRFLGNMEGIAPHHGVAPRQGVAPHHGDAATPPPQKPAATRVARALPTRPAHIEEGTVALTPTMNIPGPMAARKPSVDQEPVGNALAESRPAGCKPDGRLSDRCQRQAGLPETDAMDGFIIRYDPSSEDFRLRGFLPRDHTVDTGRPGYRFARWVVFHGMNAVTWHRCLREMSRFNLATQERALAVLDRKTDLDMGPPTAPGIMMDRFIPVVLSENPPPHFILIGVLLPLLVRTEAVETGGSHVPCDD
jgi:hypothetical protein